MESSASAWGSKSIPMRPGKGAWCALALLPVFACWGFGMAAEFFWAGLPVWAIGAVLFFLLWAPIVLRKPLVEADSQGITLQRWPFHVARIRWHHVRAVVVWESQVGSRKMVFIGVDRVPGAPQVRREQRASRRTREMHRKYNPPHIPFELACASVGVDRFNLDDVQSLFASTGRQVPVVDTRGRA